MGLEGITTTIKGEEIQKEISDVVVSLQAIGGFEIQRIYGGQRIPLAFASVETSLN